MENTIGLRILRIDLSILSIEVEEKNSEFVRKFIGGRGVNRWILLNEIKKGTKPFDPENVIVIGSGLLVGTSAPGSGRVQIDTMSPYNGGVGSGNAGGFFSSSLRFAGWDHVVIRGKSEKPIYIVIKDREVSFFDAKDLLWGKTTWETDDIIHEKHGNDFSTMCIGPAGENLVLSASIIIDKYRAAARCGVGAVLGAKNIKAIAVSGSGKILSSNADEFDRIAKEIENQIQNDYGMQRLMEKGTPLAIGPDNAMSWAPLRNFQDCFEIPDRIQGMIIDNWKVIESSKVELCYGCPVQGNFLRKVQSGPYKGTKTATTQAGAFWAFGYKLGIYDPAPIMYAQQLCNKLGLDHDSVSGAISWAYECYEKGIINREDTDGLNLTWGNDKALMVLIKKIAYREGFGDLLANGCKGASEKIGKGSKKYAMHVKGQDLMEPIRTMKGWALGVMVSPRAGTHTRGAIDTEVMRLSEEEGTKYYGVPQAGDQLSYEGKARIVVHMERLHALCDSLGLCQLMSESKGIDLPGFMEYARLCSVFLGQIITPEELMKTGERIMTLEKYFNQIHTEFTRADDYPPERIMTDPVKTGPLKGEVLHKDKWDKLLDEYYELHKWDKKTGDVPEGRLKELGILI